MSTDLNNTVGAADVLGRERQPQLLSQARPDEQALPSDEPPRIIGNWLEVRSLVRASSQVDVARVLRKYDGTVFWQCRNCGNKQLGKEPPTRCVLCSEIENAETPRQGPPLV